MPTRLAFLEWATFYLTRSPLASLAAISRMASLVGEIHAAFSSISVTLTHIMSPILQASSTFSMRWSASLEMCTNYVLAGSQLHEGTEGHQAHHAAVVQLADLGDEHDIVDALLGGVAGREASGAAMDECQIIVNVDLGAGIGHDLLDDRTAPPMTSRMLSGLMCIMTILGRTGRLPYEARRCRRHDLVRISRPGVWVMSRSVLDDLHSQAVVLQVHLDGGDALLG